MHQQIVANARELAQYTAQNLSEIVRVPSLSGDEKAVIARLAELCAQAGLRQANIDGLGNLVIRVGSGPRVLAIDAHVDVVDTGDPAQWERDPFSGEIDEGKVYGRGSVDQKGGAASMITAARVLQELAYDGAFSVCFTFTIMEEDCDGLCWNYLIEAEGLVPEMAVITEPTNLGLYLGQRGRIEFELYFGGVSAHGSAPERGDNAIYRASETALRIRDLHPTLMTDAFLGQGSVAATQIQSDSPSLCAIPDRCMIHLDRRLTWGRFVADGKDLPDGIQIPVGVPPARGERRGIVGHEEPEALLLDRYWHPVVELGPEVGGVHAVLHDDVEVLPEDLDRPWEVEP